MSTGARGKSTSLGLDDEVLVPLLARLTTLKTFLHDTPESASGSAGSSSYPRRKMMGITWRGPARTIDDPLQPPGQQDGPEKISFEARTLLEKIARELVQLNDVVGRIYETEKEIRYSFDPVERHINDALRGAEAGEGIHSKLRAVDAEMETIKAKVREAYNLGNNCGQEEDGGALLSPRAAASVRPLHGASLVKNQRTEEIRHSPQMRHLRLTVGGLEERLRGCVLCLAAFPKEDATIKKRLIIHWWIGEGFVESSKEGNNRFKELVDKGFITPLPRAHCDKIHRCKLRPWLQDLLADIAKCNAFLEVDSRDFTGTRRALLHSGKTASPLKFNPEMRTIYNIGQKCVRLGEGWFAGKEELRTLQLGQWREFDPREQIADPNQSHIEISGTESLAELDKCSNLRYISFRGISRIETLPHSIGKLREIVVLDLRACHNLEKLGQEITKLDRLEYLDLSECHLLIGMPKGMGRLTRLEVLKGFVIANLNCKDPCRLNELTKLQRLRKLSVTIGKMAAPAADEFKKLGELKALKSLTIVWGVQPSTVGYESPNSIAKMGFALPPSLEKLDLRCFPLPNFQEWIRPKDVKKLYIRGGHLRTLGDDEDWEVEVLRLRFLKDFHYDLDRLQRSFRKLNPDLTQIHKCPNFNSSVKQ